MKLGGVLSLLYVRFGELIDELPYPRDKIETEGADYALNTDREELDMTMTRIVGGNEDAIQVEITTEIRNGQLLRINPSEGFLGIDSGVIQVVGIVRGVLDPELGMVEGIDTMDLISAIESFKDSMLDLFEGTPEYGGELHKLDNEPWIVYKYQRDGEWGVLPLEEFVGHTMHY